MTEYNPLEEMDAQEKQPAKANPLYAGLKQAASSLGAKIALYVYGGIVAAKTVYGAVTGAGAGIEAAKSEIMTSGLEQLAYNNTLVGQCLSPADDAILSQIPDTAAHTTGYGAEVFEYLEQLANYNPAEQLTDPALEKTIDTIGQCLQQPGNVPDNLVTLLEKDAQPVVYWIKQHAEGFVRFIDNYFPNFYKTLNEIDPTELAQRTIDYVTELSKVPFGEQAGTYTGEFFKGLGSGMWDGFVSGALLPVWIAVGIGTVYGIYKGISYAITHPEQMGQMAESLRNSTGRMGEAFSSLKDRFPKRDPDRPKRKLFSRKNKNNLDF